MLQNEFVGAAKRSNRILFTVRLCEHRAKLSMAAEECFNDFVPGAAEQGGGKGGYCPPKYRGGGAQPPLALPSGYNLIASACSPRLLYCQ